MKMAIRYEEWGDEGNEGNTRDESQNMKESREPF